MVPAALGGDATANGAAAAQVGKMGGTAQARKEGPGQGKAEPRKAAKKAREVCFTVYD